MPAYFRKKLDMNLLQPGSSLFLAEGMSEVGFIEATLGTVEAANPNSIVVACFEGISKFRSYLSLIANHANFAFVVALGVMTDTDGPGVNRKQQVLDALAASGIAYNPAQLDGNGVHHGASRKVAVFWSPGKGLDGRIEEMVLEEIKKSDFAGCLADLKRCVIAITNEALDAKAIVQTYISLRRPNLCGCGRAFESAVLDVTDAAYDEARKMMLGLL